VVSPVPYRPYADILGYCRGHSANNLIRRQRERRGPDAYLLHYAPTSGPSFSLDWWFKGLSEWMAVQVYEPPPSVLMKLQKKYVDNYNQN
jgi:hypothetical protein